MQNNKENLGQLLLDGIESFEEDLPIRVWDNVSSELVREKGRKKTFLYLSIAASIAVIIAFGSGYFVALNNGVQLQYSHAVSYKRPFIKNPVKTTVPRHDIIANNNQPIEHPVNHKTEKENKIVIPPEKPQQTNMLSYQQSNTLLKQDTVSLIFGTVYQNKQPNIAENAVNNTKSDSAGIKKPVLDLTKEIPPHDDNQIGLINKNPNNINNNIPEKKINESEKESGKWSLAEQFSPVGYMGNTQKGAFAEQATNAYSSIDQSNNETVNNKKILLVYATGMSFKYGLNKKWGLKSGLFYATGQLRSGLQHKQLEVPVMANYGLINKKFIWELDGGFSTNFLFTDAEKSINYSALAATTIGYNISRKVSVNIQPTIKYNFSYPRSYIFSYYPISFAVYTGLSYKF